MAIYETAANFDQSSRLLHGVHNLDAGMVGRSSSRDCRCYFLGTWHGRQKQTPSKQYWLILDIEGKWCRGVCKANNDLTASVKIHAWAAERRQVCKVTTSPIPARRMERSISRTIVNSSPATPGEQGNAKVIQHKDDVWVRASK